MFYNLEVWKGKRYSQNLFSARFWLEPNQTVGWENWSVDILFSSAPTKCSALL